MPESVLDIGSGSDLSMPLLMTKFAKTVVASDVNRLASDYLVDNMINRIGLASFEASGLRYVVYKPPVMPFDNEAFDLITSTSVLEHIPKDQIIILANEIYRMLKRAWHINASYRTQRSLV
jgi:ubiquinone/menaquinone biosynthesis C-methylase UbiE